MTKDNDYSKTHNHRTGALITSTGVVLVVLVLVFVVPFFFKSTTTKTIKATPGITKTSTRTTRTTPVLVISPPPYDV